MSGTPTNPYIYYILGSDGSNFKIVSKSGGTLTDRLEISSVGNMTFNGNLNATSYIVGGTNILTITSNYTLSTSNILVTRIQSEVITASNLLVSRIQSEVTSASNILVPRIQSEVITASNILVPRIQSEVTSASNLLVSRILFEDKLTSNILVPRIQFEVTSTSNILVDAIKNNKSSQWTTSNNNIYYNEGNVGIGTTNPLNKLEVWGVLKITANSAPTNDQLGVYIWNQTNVGPTIAGNSFEVRTGGDTPRMRINTSGNVGIGTTDPRYKCHIKAIYDNIASGIHLDASDGSLVDQYTLTMYPYVIGAAMVGWKFRTISQTGGTNTPMTFDNAGNVAISGTPNSSYKLNVEGTVNATSYLLGGVDILTKITETSNYITSTSNILVSRILSEDKITSNILIGRINDTSNYVTSTSNILVNRINSSSFWTTGPSANSIHYISGNVGIGTTNSANGIYSVLHIKGTDPILTIQGQGGTGAKSQINLSTYDTSTNASGCSLIAIDDGAYGSTFKINLKTTGANTNTQFTALEINNNGFTTIGYLTAGAFPTGVKLNVYGSDSNGWSAQFKHPNNTQGIAIQYDGITGTNSGQSMNLKVTGGGAININTDGTVRFQASNSGCSVTGTFSVSGTSALTGNVGIGTTSHATYKLDVNGTVNATSYYGSGANLSGLTASQIPSLDAGKITTGTFATSQIPNLATSNIINLDTALSGKQGTINSVANQLIIGNGNGSTITSPGLTFNTSTNTFATSNIAVYGDLTVANNLTVYGNTTRLETYIYTTENLEVVNTNINSVALMVHQSNSGTNDIFVASNQSTRVFNIANNGDINITGIYKRNNRDVMQDTSNYVAYASNILVPRIQLDVTIASNLLIGRIIDTSNYILSTSNILIPRIQSEVITASNILVPRIQLEVTTASNLLVSRILFEDKSTSNILVPRIQSEVTTASNILVDAIKNNKSSQWTTSNNNIYYNTSNVGIGTVNPLEKLHIYDDINNKTKLVIQNKYVSNNTSNITSSPTAITTGITGNYIYQVFTYTTETAGTGTGQTQYTINAPSGGIVCDILIVGGGGGGGDPHGGGGGAGQLVLIYQATLNGAYTIKVGNGGIGGVFASTNPTKGSNSEFGIVIAEGGGTNGGTNTENKNGGSGAGGDAYTINGGTSGAGNKNTTIDLFPGATVYSKGNNGGIESAGIGGGGGGAGEQGQSGSFTIPGKGGDGLSGISEINFDFKTNFGNFGKLESDGKYYFAGGGGGGPTNVLNSSKGGGGTGGVQSTNPTNIGGDATPNTGSGGGGGGGGSDAKGGKGGSGIIIIRYLSPSTASSIEFVRGTITDGAVDYSLGNYDGIFKVISSTTEISTDRLTITSSGDLTYNGSINATSYLLENVNILTKITETSNYALSTSNILVPRIQSEVTSASNLLVSRILFEDKSTSNILVPRIQSEVTSASNLLVSRILFEDKSTSNILVPRIQSEVTSTSNSLIGRIVDTSNYVVSTSNILMSFISTANLNSINDRNTSNYIVTTSNILIGRINDTSNYIATVTSNIILKGVSGLNTDMINELPDAKNKFIVNNIYNNNLEITGNLIFGGLGTEEIVTSILSIYTDKIEAINTSNNSPAIMVQQKNTSYDIFVASNLNSNVFNITTNGDVNISGIYKRNNRDIIQDTSNYVTTASNILVPRIQSEVITASNILVPRIQSEVITASNILVPRIQLEVTTASNILVPRIQSEVTSASNLLVPRIQSEVTTASNILVPRIQLEVTTASNILVPRIQSEIITASNILVPRIQFEVTTTSNILVPKVNLNDTNSSNYVARISTDVNSRVWTTSQIPNLATSNIINLDTVLSGKQGTINSVANQLIIGNGNGFTITSPGLTFNTSTNTFATSNIAVYGDLTVANNLTVYGNTTRLETYIYTTENLEVVNTNINSVALMVHQSNSGTNDIFVASNQSTRVFNIANNGDVNISGIYKKNNRDVIQDTSNYVTSASNILVPRILSEVTSASNILVNRINSSTFWTAGSGSIYYNSGNVGIGTNNPRAKLDIATPDNIATATNLLDFRNISDYGIYATSISIASRGNTLDFLARDYNGGANNIRNVLSLRPEGNVGIGTNSPASILEVVNSSPIFILRDTGNGGGKIYFGNSGHGVGRGASVGTITDGNDVSLWTAGTGSIAFATTSTERMRIASNGNVGIGTNNPGNILQVGSGARLKIANNTDDFTMIGTNDTDGTTNARITLFGNTWPYGSANGNIQYTTTSTGKHIFFTGGADERMRIASNGAVSIGGTLSAGATTITGNSAVVGTLEVGAATAKLLISGNSIVAQGSDANIPLTLQTKGTSSFAINTDTTTRMTINSSGNVGIGTSSMTYSLEVSSRQPSGAGVTSFPLRITAGDLAVTNLGNNTATLIGLSTENGGGSSRIKCAIGHCRTDSSDRGSIVFLCNNVNDSNPVTMSDERMRITSTGNVGIGTNTRITNKLLVHQGSSGTGVTSFPLRISAGAYTSAGNGTATLIGLATQNDEYFEGIKCGIGHVRTGGYDVGSIVFLCNNTQDGTNATMSDERMRITSTGNVGIGTNNPTTAKLEVWGNLLMSSTNWVSGANVRILGLNTDKMIEFSFDNGTTIYDNNAIRFRTNGSERMLIASNGAVSIGGTLSAGATTITGNSAVVGTLEVGAATAELLISGNSIVAQGTDANIPLTLQTKGTSSFAINTGATPAARLSITDAGNVGIGTNTDINNKLIVHQGTTGETGATCFPLAISAGAYTNLGNGTATLIGLATYRHATSPWHKCAIGHCRTGTYDVGSIVFLCNNTNDATAVTMADERMRITSTGNVGIGTATPQSSYKLQVQGNTWIENQLVFNNSYIGGSADYACNKIMLYGGVNTPTINTNGVYGFGVRVALEYYANDGHIFYTESKGGTTYGTERLRIAINGNTGIGTTDTSTYKLNVNGSINATSLYVGGTAFTGSSQWVGTTNIYNITGNVGIGTSTTPINLLELTKSTYTGALLSLDVGAVNAGAGVMPQAIGKPLLRLGRSAYSATTGDYYGIGFGWAPLALSNSCCEIGTIITSTAGNETGDLVLSTRAVTTDIPATERMRITSAGNVGIGTATPQSSYKLQVQGNTWCENQLVFNNNYSGTGPANYACNKIALYGGGNTPTTSSYYGFGIGESSLDYFAGSAHQFYTGTVGATSFGTERLRIATNGNVGIGNTAPIGPLCIGNASVASSDGFLVLGKRDAGSTSRQFKIGISDTTFEFVIGNFGVNNVAGTWVQQFKIANSAPVNSAIIDATGGLSVFGNITAYYSDERLKTKTANISDPLKIIDKLNGFYYKPNELAHSLGITNNKQDIGLSAQEVQSVLPELVNIAPFDLEKDKDGNKVSKSGENYLTLSYDRLAPVFVEAIKELNQKNISLTIENNELKEKYNKLLEDITLIKQTLKLV